MATLVAGEQTQLRFDMTPAIDMVIHFRLPDGSLLNRNSSLWREGEKVIDLHSRNARAVVPGQYVLRSDDDMLRPMLRPMSVQ